MVKNTNQLNINIFLNRDFHFFIFKNKPRISNNGSCLTLSLPLRHCSLSLDLSSPEKLLISLVEKEKGAGEEGGGKQRFSQQGAARDKEYGLRLASPAPSFEILD